MIRTYSLSRGSSVPLYEQLYRAIRQDIASGELAGGERLPSKRQLAEHLSVSKITVENAYAQLIAEGYVTSRQRSGYYVEQLAPLAPQPAPPAVGVPDDPAPSAPSTFPFSVWARLMRSVILEQSGTLMRAAPNAGLSELRSAIAAELLRLRGMQVLPEQILIGSGTEYFYNMLIQFFGRSRVYGIEPLGYRKIAAVYRANGVSLRTVSMDEGGVIPEALQQSGAEILHFSPSHHYPTGAVTTAARRQVILRWLSQADDRWIIEDDFDSEFRFTGLPLSTLQSMDRTGRVIYLNTFTKTIAPSLRISYMILPMGLLQKWQREMGFYSCTVPSFEQLTLARFLSGGWFEKHLGRMKKHYRLLREQLLQMLSLFPEKCEVLGADVGLHVLLRLKTELSDAELAPMLKQVSLHAPFLSSFYHETPPAAARACIVLHYADLDFDQMCAALKELLCIL